MIGLIYKNIVFHRIWMVRWLRKMVKVWLLWPLMNFWWWYSLKIVIFNVHFTVKYKIYIIYAQNLNIIVQIWKIYNTRLLLIQIWISPTFTFTSAFAFLVIKYFIIIIININKLVHKFFIKKLFCLVFFLNYLVC